MGRNQMRNIAETASNDIKNGTGRSRCARLRCLRAQALLLNYAHHLKADLIISVFDLWPRLTSSYVAIRERRSIYVSRRMEEQSCRLQEKLPSKARSPVFKSLFRLNNL